MNSKTETGKAPVYGPVPTRAIADRELTATDWRVLTCIASHDRLGGNKRGCDVGRERMAYLVDADQKTVTASVKRLDERGYISAHRHSKDGRRRTYRVIYTDEDRDEISKVKNPTNKGRVRSKNMKCGRPFGGNRATNLGGVPATEYEGDDAPYYGEIEGTTQAETPANKPNSYSNTLYRDRKSHSHTKNTFGGSRAPDGAMAVRGVGGVMAQIAREWREKEISYLEARDRLLDVADDISDQDDPKAKGQFKRLAEDLGLLG